MSGMAKSTGDFGIPARRIFLSLEKRTRPPRDLRLWSTYVCVGQMLKSPTYL